MSLTPAHLAFIASALAGSNQRKEHLRYLESLHQQPRLNITNCY